MMDTTMTDKKKPGAQAKFLKDMAAMPDLSSEEPTVEGIDAAMETPTAAPPVDLTAISDAELEAELQRRKAGMGKAVPPMEGPAGM